MNDELRALFPVTRDVVYLNHAAVSPPPIPVLRAVQAQLADVSRYGSINYRKWVAVREDARRLAANMIGARPEQIAFMRNTSDALSTVATGLDWKRGDNLVTFRGEFPSNMYPWLRLRDQHGIEVRMCEERAGRIDVEELLALIDDRTRIIALSLVQYGSGFRADLRPIGHAARVRNALLVVDVIQAMGALPVNVEAQLVDVAAGACHKWLLAPEGIGFLYLSDRALKRINPTLVGWRSVINPEDFSNFDQEWNPGAMTWETGSAPTSLFYGLKASLELLNEIGIEPIAKHLRELMGYFCQHLDPQRYEVISSRKPGEDSQIVCIRHRGNVTPLALYRELKKRNIIVAPRGDRLRISPHVYNTTDDIDKLLDALP